MAYVAIERLRWGDGEIEPGGEVPAGEPGRDYAAMLRHGQIAEVSLDGINEAQSAAIEKLRLDDLARAERAETDLHDANDRVTQALTERDEALARAEQAEQDTAALTAERDELAKQLEEATAPAEPPASKPAAAKKPAARK